jgi:hypothetical protein
VQRLRTRISALREIAARRGLEDSEFILHFTSKLLNSSLVQIADAHTSIPNIHTETVRKIQVRWTRGPGNWRFHASGQSSESMHYVDYVCNVRRPCNYTRMDARIEATYVYMFNVYVYYGRELCYEPEYCGFHFRWSNSIFFTNLILPVAPWLWCRLSL